MLRFCSNIILPPIRKIQMLTLMKPPMATMAASKSDANPEPHGCHPPPHHISASLPGGADPKNAWYQQQVPFHYAVPYLNQRIILEFHAATHRHPRPMGMAKNCNSPTRLIQSMVSWVSLMSLPAWTPNSTRSSRPSWHDSSMELNTFNAESERWE